MRFALYSLKAGERPGVPQATRSPHCSPGRANVLPRHTPDPQIICGFPLGASSVRGAAPPHNPRLIPFPLDELTITPVTGRRATGG